MFFYIVRDQFFTYQKYSANNAISISSTITEGKKIILISDETPGLVF